MPTLPPTPYLASLRETHLPFLVRPRVFDRVPRLRVLWAVIIYQQPFEELSSVGAIPLDIEAGPTSLPSRIAD